MIFPTQHNATPLETQIEEMAAQRIKSANTHGVFPQQKWETTWRYLEASLGHARRCINLSLLPWHRAVLHRVTLWMYGHRKPAEPGTCTAGKHQEKRPKMAIELPFNDVDLQQCRKIIS